MTDGSSERISQAPEQAPPAHPLARELARVLAAEGGRVLVLGFGDGRSLPPLLEAGLRVDVIEDDAERAARARAWAAGRDRVRVARSGYAGPYPFSYGYAGLLATSALLHGAPQAIAAALGAARNRLAPGAALRLTLGNGDDPRRGAGTRLDPWTWAAASGDEAGVPHAYFTERDARALLRDFRIDGLEAGAAPGRWAHDEGAAARIVHWFVRATYRPAGGGAAPDL